jgi:hypothetical protein
MFYSPTYNIAPNSQSRLLGPDGMKEEELRRTVNAASMPHPDLMPAGGPNWFFARHSSIKGVAEPKWSLHAIPGLDLEALSKYTTLPPIITDMKVIQEENRIEYTQDASIFWKRPNEWLNTQLDVVPLWMNGSYYVPQAETDMFCIQAYKDRHLWKRDAMGLKAGDTVIINKASDKDYLMTLYGDIIIRGDLYPTEEILTITSEDVAITAETDTVLLRNYYEG